VVLPAGPPGLLSGTAPTRRTIARHRDALREILDGREAVIGSADRGIEALDEAVASLSEYV
jgi:hypothetical protein